ncbi:MAG: DEAD/DEAH box helicase [Lentisphaeria bacterium]
MTSPLAHSAQGTTPEQSYRNHIGQVHERVRTNIACMSKFYAGDAMELTATVQWAAAYHDLGKLCSQNQRVLRKKNSRDSLPVKHNDAGTVYLMGLRMVEAGQVVFCHHTGLRNIPDEDAKGPFAWRVPEAKKITDAELHDYLELHKHELHDLTLPPLSHATGWRGLTKRLCLSCLVDADHGDTATHYEEENTLVIPPVKWTERLLSLDNYVSSLGKQHEPSVRNNLRQDIYSVCRDGEVSGNMIACSSPVGTGKTTAVMAHLLCVAKARNLRHIFVVLPYTSIIKQSVDVYRRALCLPGENPEEIVAEHHHLADFSKPDCRQMATLWNAPIIVTTAVQFFETLGSCSPARLRKMHQLPGSAVFIDEAHASMPIALWPQQWSWMQELADQWSCHFVFASGSLAKFWEIDDFVPDAKSLPDLLPVVLQKKAEDLEVKRVTFPPRNAPWSLAELLANIVAKSGPRLVILNTVQSAAVVADALRKVGHHVLHISTALTPYDRTRIIERVKRLLEFRNVLHDWTLVATSCVEAGMDFSFRVAFRESANVASLLQIGGRTNRDDTDETAAEVIDFRVFPDDLLCLHPAFSVGKEVMDSLFDNGWLDGSKTLSELCTKAIADELVLMRRDLADKLCKAERTLMYADVGNLCKVISADTRTVLISPMAIQKAKRHKLSARELQLHSVQLWGNKIEKLALLPLFHDADLYVWTLPYDPDFLGYMAGVLPILRANRDGLTVV